MDLILRMAAATDGAGIHAIYAPIVADTAISFETEVPSVDQMARRVASTAPRLPWLVVDHEGVVAGYAYASAHRSRQAYDWSADVSVYVAPGQRRRSLGRALYTALLELLSALHYRQAHAGITLPNPGSVGLHEAVGFVPVGVYRRVGWKLGAWHDVGWWQRPLGLVDGPAHALRSLDDLTGAELAAALAAGQQLIRP